MDMTPELAHGIVVFNAVNERSWMLEPDSPEVRAAMLTALSVARDNAEALGNYFGKRLANATLSARTKNITFHFNSAEEAAEAFKMGVRQQVDEKRAQIFACSMLNLVAHDLNYPSAYEGDDHITGTLLLAHGLHAYRLATAREFLAIAQGEVARRKRKGTILTWCATIAGVVALLWLRRHLH